MSKEDKRKESRGRSSHHGSAARTRPLSFEEIMSKRKKKLEGADFESPSGLEKQTVQTDAKIVTDHLGYVPGSRKEKVNERALKTDDRHKGEGSHVKSKDKSNRDSEAHPNEKEKSIHNKSIRDKEKKTEKHKHYHSRDSDKKTASSVTENEKQQQKHLLVSDKHDGSDTKYAGQAKRKEHERFDSKNREELDRPKLKRHDSGKIRGTEYADKNDRRKEDSKLYREVPKSKRRRSRSREYDRERHRSVSLSPQAQKHASKRRDYEQSSPQSFKEKSRRKYSDGDKRRASGNDGYNSAHYRKHGSGLGGYSPRKRRTEAAVKTPSPPVRSPDTVRSPDRKTATWDQPPPGSGNSEFAHIFANIQSAVAKVHNMASAVPVTPTAKISQPMPPEIASLISASVDSVQLTQATRPLRRLYVENLPSSMSEKAVIDCINNFLAASGTSHIKGTSPCISCMINKEKSQALVEFLTPEDATAALSFDGRSFSGSILKIRRPKEFVEAATEVPEKTKEAEPVSNAVKDSAHKIFVGGVSVGISSDMLMEIVSAFGALKAFYFEFNDQINEQCAFFEYLDPSITLKACTGLNGMKLGGKILTAVQAFPDYKENVEISVSYDIPLHAKPLLATSTKVLQLKNMLGRDELLLLSESELDEMLEDVRLECVRFGAVKSLNVVRHDSKSESVTEAPEMHGGEVCVDSKMESPRSNSGQGGEILTLGDIKKPSDISCGAVDPQSNSDIHMVDTQNEVNAINDGTNCNETQLIPDCPVDPQTNPNMNENVKYESTENDLVSETVKQYELETKLDENDGVETSTTHLGEGMEYGAEKDTSHEAVIKEEHPSTSNIDYNKESVKSNSQDQSLTLFEPGCVLVEFLREDASCLAAHCLHGRIYGERVVTAGFFPHDLYLARFPR